MASSSVPAGLFAELGKQGFFLFGRRFGTSAQVTRQEFFGRRIEGLAVLRARKTVPFVGRDSLLLFRREARSARDASHWMAYRRGDGAAVAGVSGNVTDTRESMLVRRFR